MSNIRNKKNPSNHKTKIGGQALIEGIMMNGIAKQAMAIRMKDGSIDVEEWEAPKAKWFNKAPFIRGTVNFINSLLTGYKCMMKSAEKSGMMDDDGEEMSKFELWLTKKFGDKLMNFLMFIAMVFGVGMALFLFMFVPAIAFSGIQWLCGETDISVWRSAFEGVLKIIIFIAYMAVVAQMKDIRRTYEYHGAEHKTIACYEAGEELTVENIKKHIRFHPRCGTSFIFLVLFVSIIVYTLLPINSELFQAMGMSVMVSNILRVLCKLITLPFVIGIAYELIRIAGRHDNIFTRILSAPGLWIQRLTTREPDASQIEIAIAAVTPVLPKDGEDDRW